MNLSDSIYSRDPTQRDLEDARDLLMERLKDWRQVGRCDIFDALDCEMQDERYKLRFAELVAILRAAPGERAAMVDTFLHGVAERYLNDHEDLVQEMADELYWQEM